MIIHPNPYTVHCPTCQCSFTNANAVRADAALRMHIARAHTRTIPTARVFYPNGTSHSAVCPACNRSYMNVKPSNLRTAFKMHWTRHHSGEVPEIPITHSAPPLSAKPGQRLSSSPRPAPRIGKPPVTHLPSGQHQTACPVCSVAYTDRNEYRLRKKISEHIRTHHPIRTEAQATPIPFPETPEQNGQPTTPTTHQGHREKIKWTDDELSQVIQRAAQLRLEEINLPLLTLVTQAQEVLPNERHRPLRSWASLPDNMVQLIKLRMDVLRKQEIDSIPPQIITVPVKEPVPVDPIQFTSSLPTPLLLAEIFTRFTRRIDGLEHALALAVAHRTEADLPKPTAPIFRMPPPANSNSTPAPARKPRLAIVGLFKDQFAFVADKLGERQHDVELVWVDKERNSADLPAVDGVIVQKFTRHKWYEEARDKLGNDKVWFADGGIQSVAQRVLDFLSRQRRT